MKKRVYIFISALLALNACGTVAQYSSSGSRFQDGIYYRNDNTRQEASQKETAQEQKRDELIAQTREAENYLFPNDTKPASLPDSRQGSISFKNNTGTEVTIESSPDLTIYFNTTPWTYYRPITYSSAFWDPWYYGRYWGYYSPWHYDSWHFSPWVYDSYYWGVSFWNPWYYGGYWAGYDPWWHHHHGWHGHWAPGYYPHPVYPGPSHIHRPRRDVYYGHRNGNSMTSSSSIGRNSGGGFSRSAQTGRQYKAQGSTSSVPRQVTASRASTTYKRTAPSDRTVSAVARPAQSDRRTTASSGTTIKRNPGTAMSSTSSTRTSTYRRSQNTAFGNAGTSSSGYSRSSSSYNRSAGSGTQRSSGTFNSGSSSSRQQDYNRTPSYNRSSQSSSSYNRSSSGSSAEAEVHHQEEADRATDSIIIRHT